VARRVDGRGGVGQCSECQPVAALARRGAKRSCHWRKEILPIRPDEAILCCWPSPNLLICLETCEVIMPIVVNFRRPVFRQMIGKWSKLTAGLSRLHRRSSAHSLTAQKIACGTRTSARVYES